MNTSAEPVVNLCEVKNPPLTVEESKRFKCHQRLLRSSIGILIFVLIALTIGSSPVIVMVPGFFFLHWLNTYEESKKSKYHQLLLHSTISILIFFLIAFSTVPPSVIVLVLVIYLLYWLSMFTHRPIRRFFDLCTGNWITVMTVSSVFTVSTCVWQNCFLFLLFYNTGCHMEMPMTSKR